MKAVSSAVDDPKSLRSVPNQMVIKPGRPELFLPGSNFLPANETGFVFQRIQ